MSYRVVTVVLLVGVTFALLALCFGAGSVHLPANLRGKRCSHVVHRWSRPGNSG